jgi:hypothetical protein
MGNWAIKAWIDGLFDRLLSSIVEKSLGIWALHW